MALPPPSLPQTMGALLDNGRLSFSQDGQAVSCPAVDAEACMAWVMKAEGEDAAGQLQEAAGSFMKAAKLCKLSGDAANQEEFAARARDVLGRLKEINQSSVDRLKGAGAVNQSGEPLITIISDPKQQKTFVEDAVDAIKRQGLEVPADMQREADAAARERAARQ